MTEDTKIWDEAEELISVPRAHLKLELTQEQKGLVLRYDGQRLVECFLTENGMLAGGFMAESLGVKLPKLGETVDARVSTGVLFRAVSIASLDFGNEESYTLLNRWLDEAKMQRGGGASEA
ncbi:MAG: hypothetical protein O2854_09450 [Chloroflexi bacterium]|nr:hypothetical protein [Chloroflexota bacterium]